MRRRGLAGWTPGRLRLVLGLFLLALAVPTTLLIRHAYEQLQWQAFRQQQLLAEELTARVDGQLARLVAAEGSRGFAEYGFLVATGEPPSRFVQRSPLSSYPPAAALPGLVAHFQVDGAGTLTSPLVPSERALAAEYGVAADELAQRVALQDEVRRLLASADARGAREAARETEGAKATSPRPRAAVTAESAAAASAVRRKDAPAEAKSVPQSVFDELADAAPASPAVDRDAPLGRVEDLKLAERFQQAAPAAGGALAPAPPSPAQNLARAEKRSVRKERSAIVEAAPAAAREADGATAQAGPVPMFESEIGPLQAERLGDGHLVLFRYAWHDGQRYVQGLVVALRPFLAQTVESALRETVLAQTTDLVVAWRGAVLAAFAGKASRRYAAGTEGLAGELLYRARLSPPFDGLELVYSVGSLPAGPGGAVVGWLAGVIAVVMLGGVLLLYRLGVRQLALARQQQDFVAAVSHELKTPLTSIRMYGEMLREGWAPEEKKATYYAYIHDESERLSRLIGNVLQLARMTRNDLQLAPRPVTAAELLSVTSAKIASPVERAGFTLETRCEDETRDAMVEVDPDAFSQILINLVDNAIKFSANAPTRRVEIGCRRGHGDRVVFSVRDHGPGVPRAQRRKIFRLFYRGPGPLARETSGTGIGLALVQQLAHAMGGTVDVVDRDPGAEFSVAFPVARPPPAGT